MCNFALHWLDIQLPMHFLNNASSYDSETTYTWRGPHPANVNSSSTPIF